MKLPHVTWLRAFEAAARHSSFAAASEELGLTSAAVSQQIRLLEKHLKVRLFERLPRGVALTDIGQAYAQPVRRSFRELETATNGLFQAPRRRSLRVRASISCAALVIAPRLAEFRQHHPEVAVELSTFVWADRFDMENSDIDIRWGQGDWPERSVRRLAGEHAIIVCRPDHAASFGPRPDIRQIAGATVYQITGTEHDWGRMSEHFDLDLPQSSDPVRVDSSMIALSALTAGPGSVIVLESFARPYLASGQLVSPFDYRLPVASAHYLVHRDGVEARPEVVAFSRWIAALYRQLGTEDAPDTPMPQSN